VSDLHGTLASARPPGPGDDPRREGEPEGPCRIAAGLGQGAREQELGLRQVLRVATELLAQRQRPLEHRDRGIGRARLEQPLAHAAQGSKQIDAGIRGGPLGNPERESVLRQGTLDLTALNSSIGEVEPRGEPGGAIGESGLHERPRPCRQLEWLPTLTRGAQRDGEIAQRGRHLGMVGAQSVLADRQGPTKVRRRGRRPRRQPTPPTSLRSRDRGDPGPA
jgi:hypothetical protein